MSFSSEDLKAVMADLPGSAFGLEQVEARLEWVQFVCGVDETPKNKHDAKFYVVVARALAEVMGSCQPGDYQEAHMRTQIIDLIKAGAKPFQDTEDPWKDVTISPAWWPSTEGPADFRLRILGIFLVTRS